MLSLDGEIAYVTGAGSGIGRATALQLSRMGASVVLLGRTAAGLLETQGECSGPAETVVLELSDADAVENLLPPVVRRVGAPTIVVHSAGETVVGSLDSLTEEQWDRQMNSNLKAIFLVNRVLWPAMVDGGGSIVLIASRASFVGFPKNAAYVASKGAVLSMTRAMALDGARHRIRVNAVCPGLILTPNLQNYFDGQADPEQVKATASATVPVGRMGQPEEVAHAVTFLVSRDADFITGASLVVDGGLLARAPS